MEEVIYKCTVEIRPLEFKKWHGKTGEENFTQTKKFGALVDANAFKYVTGLTEKEIGILKENGFKHDLTNDFDPENPHEFWDSIIPRIELKNSTSFLEVDINKHPIDYIKYKIIKSSRYVANSMREYEEGLYPEATHVIINEAEEADFAASKIEMKNMAVELSNKLSPERKVQIVLLMSGKSLKNQSANYVTVQLAKLIESDPEGFIKYAEYENKELLANRALVIDCLDKQVLIKRGHKIYYHDSHLGDDDVTVAEYLSKPENQELLLRLTEQLG